MSKLKAWIMVILNLLLIYLVATNSMWAMWLMAIIMLLDALRGLWMAYQKK